MHPTGQSDPSPKRIRRLRPTSWPPAIRFLAQFALLLGGFYAVVLFPWCDRIFYRYLCANAWLSNQILHGFGQATNVDEITIRSAAFVVTVRRGCDAIEPAWFFIAAVLAFPAPWRRKPRALLLGATAILVLNLVRIVSLFLIGVHLPEFFPVAHLEIWPALFILTALGFWLGWMRTVIAGGSAA